MGSIHWNMAKFRPQSVLKWKSVGIHEQDLSRDGTILVPFPDFCYNLNQRPLNIWTEHFTTLRRAPLRAQGALFGLIFMLMTFYDVKKFTYIKAFLLCPLEVVIELLEHGLFFWQILDFAGFWPPIRHDSELAKFWPRAL